jgi:hypothetical protein
VAIGSKPRSAPGIGRATFGRFSASWESSRLPWAYACENGEHSRKNRPIAGLRNLANTTRFVKGYNAKRGEYSPRFAPNRRFTFRLLECSSVC